MFVQSTGEGANLFLRFVARRYELGWIIIISHQRLGARGGVFIWRPGEQSGIFPCCEVAGKGGGSVVRAMEGTDHWREQGRGLRAFRSASPPEGYLNFDNQLGARTPQ